jgi:hypothetical protein
MNETVVERKACKQCNCSFTVAQWDSDFYDKISPTFVGQKFQIPTPTLCPDCRQQRRLLFRNERKLYRRICDATQQPIISIYSPDKPHKVYDQKTWWSDSRNPLDYGFDFDFGKSFTENFRELLATVPHCSIININSQNSDYTNICANNKNCYLLVESSNNEDCYHWYRLQKSSDCVDCGMVNNSQNCYEGVDLDDCYWVYYSHYCRWCSHWYLLEDCVGCKFCFGCIGLENKQYMIFNKQATKEEYDSIVDLFLWWDENQKDEIITKWKSLKPVSWIQHVRNSENATGDYIYDAANIKHSYEIHDAKDVSYSRHVRFNSGNCTDVDTVGYNSFWMYESINTALDANHNSFCMRCWSGCNNLLYCFNCDSCSDCFGCIWLRNKQYCIFNRQYTKEEYEAQVVKIINHMIATGERGEFFHPSLSPFGYNETVAQEYYPLEVKSQRLYGKGDENIDFSENWYHRSTYEAPAPHSDKVIEWQDLPSTITEIEDSILQYAIKCEVTWKLFRIQPQELTFYRKHNISLPRKHPDQRHLERLALRR